MKPWAQESCSKATPFSRRCLRYAMSFAHQCRHHRCESLPTAAGSRCRAKFQPLPPLSPPLFAKKSKPLREGQFEGYKTTTTRWHHPQSAVARLVRIPYSSCRALLPRQRSKRDAHKTRIVDAFRQHNAGSLRPRRGGPTHAARANLLALSPRWRAKRSRRDSAFLEQDTTRPGTGECRYARPMLGAG